MNYREKMSQKKRWEQLLYDNDTRYHITPTYLYNISKSHSDHIIKQFIRMLNKEYFGHNSKKSFFKGFVINEKHNSGCPHSHILIQYHRVLDERDKDFNDVVRRKFCHFDEVKTEDTNDKRNDKNVGVLVQDYHYGKIEKYLTKSIFRGEDNFDFINPLTLDGF